MQNLLMLSFISSCAAIVRAMLSVQPSQRPPAQVFAACAMFQDDILLKSIKFLDTILQRETSQKVRERGAEDGGEGRGEGGGDAEERKKEREEEREEER